MRLYCPLQFCIQLFLPKCALKILLYFIHSIYVRKCMKLSRSVFFKFVTILFIRFLLRNSLHLTERYDLVYWLIVKKYFSK